MNSEEFKSNVLNKSDKDYGICPPPTKAQDGLNVLINHFLGEDWYVTLSVSQEQVNTEAIYTILQKYPKRKLPKNVFTKILKTIIFIFIGIPMSIISFPIFIVTEVITKIKRFINEYIIDDIKRIWKGEL